MKIQFSFKETKQFCSQLNLGQHAITTTFGPYCNKKINFWGHFVKTHKSPLLHVNTTRTQNFINVKTTLKEQNNLSFSVFRP